ncbi:MAG: hypothetical protein E7812_04210 [Phenylobacterium sp.]|nr:MAG: hypothetical protein E7812_04210 [Phenylobacterium sp.]
MTRAIGASGDQGRLHGLDAVRGYALLLGIVFHATMSFIPGPQIWVVEDTHRSLFLSGVFFVSHIFRMATFFLIAGFFAHMVVGKRGVKAFVKDRAKRILVPLVVGWPILIVAIIAASAYGGYVMTGHIPKPPPPAAHAPPLAFPLTHLWFLYLLLWLYAATLALRAGVARLDPAGRLATAADRLVKGVVENRAGVLVLALPTALALNSFAPWALWGGVPAPDSSLIPNPPAVVAFFSAFGFGWLLHRQPGLLQTWTRRWVFNLTASVVLTAVLIAWIGLTPNAGPHTPGPERLGYAMTYALAIWTWTFAVIGLALRFLSKESPARRYIADSSYWLYLIHLPIVMVLQALVVKLDWPAEVKILVVLGAAFPLMFASYQLLVRHSFIGAILNGRRAPKPARAAPAALRLEPAE